MSSVRIDFAIGNYRGGIGISTFDGLKFWRFSIKKEPKRYNVGSKKYCYHFYIGPFWGYAEPYPKLLSERRKAKIEAAKQPNIFTEAICHFIRKQ